MIGLIKVSRSTKELLLKIKLVEEELLKNGEEATIEKLSKKLKKTKEEIAFAIESKRPIESIDENIYSDISSGKTRIDEIKNDKDETNTLINKICLNKIIQELENRDKQIIILRYYRDMSQKEVANLFKISQVQVSRIEKRVLLEMRNKISA